MKHKYAVIIFPTEQPSNIFLKTKELEFNVNPPLHGIKDLGWKYQHVYIVSDDTTKGNLVIGKSRARKGYETGFKRKDYEKDSCYLIPKSGDGFWTDDFYNIIASTDKAITPDSWIHDSFVVDYVKAYNEGKPINEVSLETELLCCQTGRPCGFPCNGNCSKNAVESTKTKSDGSVVIYDNNTCFESLPKTKSDGSIIVDPSETYTRKEVVRLIEKAVASFHSGQNGLLSITHTWTTKWIEENLQ